MQDLVSIYCIKRLGKDRPGKGRALESRMVLKTLLDVASVYEAIGIWHFDISEVGGINFSILRDDIVHV